MLQTWEWMLIGAGLRKTLLRNYYDIRPMQEFPFIRKLSIPWALATF